MARISLRDAQRLGIVAPDSSSPGSRAQGPKGKSWGAPKKSAPIPPRLTPAQAAALGKPEKPEPRRRLLRDDPARERFAVSVSVPIAPKPKQRARTFLSKAAIVKAFTQAKGNLNAFLEMLGMIKHSSYTPDATREFEMLVGRMGAAAMRGRPAFGGPIEVVVRFVLRGDPAYWPTAHNDPDLDNLEKAVFDALNGIVFNDDVVVVRKWTEKRCGAEPSVTLTVRDAHPDSSETTGRETLASGAGLGLPAALADREAVLEAVAAE